MNVPLLSLMLRINPDMQKMFPVELIPTHDREETPTEDVIAEVIPDVDTAANPGRQPETGETEITINTEHHVLV